MLEAGEQSAFRREARPARPRAPLRGLAPQPAAQAGAQAPAKLAWPVKLLLVSLFIPWLVPLAGTEFTVSRLVMLVLTVPVLAKWLGQAGRNFRAADGLLILFCVWGAICLTLAHGVGEAIRPAGLLFVETVTPFLIARLYIRSLADLSAVLRFLFRALLVVAAFAILETITGRNVLATLFGAILPTGPLESNDSRFGLWRAQVVFEHAIHLGVFGASLLPFMLLMPQGKTLLMRLAGPTAAIVATFASLSSGPVAALGLQAGLIAWDRMARRNPYRWAIVFGAIALAYLLLALVSKRSIFEIYITYFTFSQQSSWYRMAIWTYTWISVTNHPWFGIGQADWARPSWMYSTIDIYWMVQAVRYGLPGAILLLLACLATIVGVVRARIADEAIGTARLAYVVSMAGLLFCSLTVHYWGAMGVYFLFMLGAGAWMAEAPTPMGRRAGGIARAPS